MAEEILDYIKYIKKAAAKVPEQYLNLTTTYEPSGIVRERVFCYELYHQLRLILDEFDEDEKRLTLNGEIDKRGHTGFKKADRKNPDFIFHIPGEHEGNTVITEVKGKIDKRGILKDFKTLTTFVSSYNYKAGVFILYNHSINDLLQNLGNELTEEANSAKYSDNIFILTLPKAHKSEDIKTLTSLPNLLKNTKTYCID